ncbi:MAG: hypothetical protein K6343_00700 [Caldisericaceae bacterium]
MGNLLLGITLNETAMRCAIIENTENNFKIRALKEFTYPNFEEALTDKTLINSVRSFIKNFRYVNCAVSIPQNVAFTRIKNVPKLPNDKIFKLIQSEIKDYAIFKQENVALGFIKVDDNADSQNVLWAGIKEPILLNILTFLKQCKIKANIITIPQIGIVFGISEFYKEIDPYVVINIDKDSTTLTAVQGKKVLYNYIQDIGYEVFEKDDVSSKNIFIGNIVSTLNFITRTQNISIKKIFLIAHTDITTQIVSSLSNRLPLAPIMLSIPESIEIINEEDYLEIQKNQGNKYFVSVALAVLSQLKEKDISLKINEYFVRERVSESLKVFATVLTLIVINGAAVIAYPILKTNLTEVENNIKNVSKSISEISIPSLDVKKLQDDLQSLKDKTTKLQLLENSLNDKVKFSTVLDDLAVRLPSSTTIETLAIKEDNTIFLRSITNLCKSAFDYEENLSRSNVVENQTVLRVINDKTQNVIFEMEMKIRGKK